MPKTSFFISILFIGFVLHIWNMPDSTFKSPLYIYNGTIITMDDNQPKADAVFIDKGKIIVVGFDSELKENLPENTELIDLNGAVLLPGFIDPHTHPVASTFFHDMIDLSGFKHKSNLEIWEFLESEIQSYQFGEWILCKGLDVVLIEDLIPPHISYLDSIAPNNPLIISSLSMHSFWGNTLAFKEAGINDKSPNPSKSSFYGKDNNGKLTGYISEQVAFEPFKKAVIKAIGNTVLKEKSVAVLDSYVQKGNTTITSMGLTTDDPNVIRLYEHLSSKNPKILNQLLQIVGMLPKRKPTVRHIVFIRDDASHLLPDSPNNGDDFFKISGIKFWYDGSPYTGSMYLSEPFKSSYVNQEKIHIPIGHKGKSLLNKKELIRAIQKYDSAGWQVAIHTQGDQAIKETLNAIEISGISRRSNPRLEHCLLLDDESIHKMAELGASPSFHINHLWYYGEALENHIIGKNRTKKILPIQSAKKAGLTFSLHADQPMFESAPLSLIHTAVNRKTRYGKPIGRENKISILEALKAMTIYAARQINMEKKIGSITPGKYADLVILDQNPLKVAPEKLKDIKVKRTIINGCSVFIQ